MPAGTAFERIWQRHVIRSYGGDRALVRIVPLLEGLDQLQFMPRSASDIAAFEAADEAARPWIHDTPAMRI